MSKVVIYERPGCPQSLRQKALLEAAGHDVETRNLLTEAWSAALLRPYFGSTPVRDWFDSLSPRVVSGEIDLERVNPQAALTMMILDPALIRQPLVKAGGHCMAGVDEAAISALPRA